ncbi:DUF7511 domain-containing protein [Halarchaeum sp. P4]|uniref:DUF7511 domain-containing protein n=1 Tax=Halarchaeum sp. P4 TaxID=3421639 RepID=UPI003EB9C44A
MSEESPINSAEKTDDCGVGAGAGTVDAADGPRRDVEVTAEPTPPPVRGVVEEADDGEVFTLYPPDVPNAALTTTWMSAHEGAYVSLADYR